MIVLDEPYVSEPLIAWLEESQHPVLDSSSQAIRGSDT